MSKLPLAERVALLNKIHEMTGRFIPDEPYVSNTFIRIESEIGNFLAGTTHIAPKDRLVIEQIRKDLEDI